MAAKRPIRMFMILMIFITSFFICNKVIKADNDSLETGLYVYIGKNDPKDDNDLTCYYKEASVTPGKPFSIVYVVKNDEGFTRTVIDKNNESLNIGEGLTLSYANFDNQFVTANANSGGEYIISFNSSSVTITLLKMAQGLYIYNGKESPINDTDSSHYITSKEYGINNDVRVILVYVDENGEKRTANPGTISRNDNDLMIRGAENSFIIFSSSSAKEYVVKYKNGETVTDYSVTLKFVVSGSSLATFDIEGTKFYFGLVNWAGKNDGTENAFMVSYKPFDQTGFVLNIPSAFVGTTRQQANDSVASQGLMNCISNLTVTLDDSSTINRSAVQISHRENKANVFGVNCEWYDLTIDTNYFGSAIFKVEFDLTLGEKTTRLASYQEYEVIEYHENSIELTENEMGVFDYYFNPDSDQTPNRKSAYDKLEALLNSRGKTVNREEPQDIVVILPKGTFIGMYHINLQDYLDANNMNSITFRGNTDDNGKATTVKGGFVVNGGRVKFENLKMEGYGEISYTDNSERAYSNTKVGIIAEKVGNENNLVADIPWIFNCSFKDYDYALISTKKGVVASCNYNYFENNNYCFYMECDGTMFSTGAVGNYGNVFVNSKKAAIALMSTPDFKPFDVMFYRNLFFSNDTEAVDFYVEEDGTEDKKACYLMMYNYYGKVLSEDHNSVTAENIRSARVDYGNTRNAIVYTNPCLMFPAYQNINRYNNEEDILNDDGPYTMDGVLGLDSTPGLFSCSMNNARVTLNGSAKNNLTQFEILELKDNGVKQLGGLRNE